MYVAADSNDGTGWSLLFVVLPGLTLVGDCDSPKSTDATLTHHAPSALASSLTWPAIAADSNY
jgi:hypothetical protein